MISRTDDSVQGLALLTLSWDKNWDSHSLVNGYPSFNPRIALVAPSPGMETFPRYWHFVREPIGARWITLTKGQKHGALMFTFCSSEQTVEQAVELPVIRDAMTLVWRHCNVAME